MAHGRGRISRRTATGGSACRRAGCRVRRRCRVPAARWSCRGSARACTGWRSSATASIMDAQATRYDVKLTSGRNEALTDGADGRGFAMGLEAGRRRAAGLRRHPPSAWRGRRRAAGLRRHPPSAWRGRRCRSTSRKRSTDRRGSGFRRAARRASCGRAGARLFGRADGEGHGRDVGDGRGAESRGPKFGGARSREDGRRFSVREGRRCGASGRVRSRRPGRCREARWKLGLARAWERVYVAPRRRA